MVVQWVSVLARDDLGKATATTPVNAHRQSMRMPGVWGEKKTACTQCYGAKTIQKIEPGINPATGTSDPQWQPQPSSVSQVPISNGGWVRGDLQDLEKKYSEAKRWAA